MEKFGTVDEYINSFPQNVKQVLVELRKRIEKLVPEAVEGMSYGMPGYKMNGKPLVYFAAFKAHIGFFPTPSGIEALGKETQPYRTGKGTLQFKLDKPIPWGLVEKIVKFRIKELQQL